MQVVSAFKNLKIIKVIVTNIISVCVNTLLCLCDFVVGITRNWKYGRNLDEPSIQGFITSTHRVIREYRYLWTARALLNEVVFINKWLEPWSVSSSYSVWIVQLRVVLKIKDDTGFEVKWQWVRGIVWYVSSSYLSTVKFNTHVMFVNSN